MSTVVVPWVARSRWVSVMPPGSTRQPPVSISRSPEFLSWAERGDLLTVDPQIGDGRSVRTDDRAAPNDGAHARFSFPMRMTRPGLAAVED